MGCDQHLLRLRCGAGVGVEADFLFCFHVRVSDLLLRCVALRCVVLSLSSCDSLRDAKTFLFLSIVGHYSLFPLLFRPTETPLKLLLVAVFTQLSLLLLTDYHRKQQAARSASHPTDGDAAMPLSCAVRNSLTQLFFFFFFLCRRIQYVGMFHWLERGEHHSVSGFGLSLLLPLRGSMC